MKHLPALLAVTASLWPAVLAAGWFDSAHGEQGLVATGTYVVASHVCHQRPERSFSTLRTQWPVCGRCAGLYLAAPLGAWAAFAKWRTRFRHPRPLLAVTALPTVVTVVLEWASPSSVTSVVRALAALPLGASLAFLVVSASASTESQESIG